jgi:predicted RNase H-like HicB family nuclease
MLPAQAMWWCRTQGKTLAKILLRKFAKMPGYKEMRMRYPVAIEPGTDTTAFGVVFPDLPGCFSAGDTLDEAMQAAEEAVAAWLDATLDAGEPVPAPSSLEAVRANPKFAGWIFAVISVNPDTLDDTTERVNITLPRRVLARLDAQARAAGESRSGYIVQMTLEAARV